VNAIYMGGSDYYVSKPAQKCPVPWCASLHEEPEEPHYGTTSDVLVTLDAYNSGVSVREQEIIEIGLDQLKVDGDVMISICGTHGTMWLTLQEAKRFAVRLLQLDLDAGTLP
jgi:hypothetical protein